MRHAERVFQVTKSEEAARVIRYRRVDSQARQDFDMNSMS